MAYDYAREKFWNAIEVLVGDGGIQERLAGAAMYLTRLYGRDGDVPDGQRDEFNAVMRALTNVEGTGGEGAIAATTRKLDSEEAAKLARRILSIYTQLHGGI